MKLSPNFTLEEMCASDTAARMGIDNTPSANVIENLRALCREVLQPLRNVFGVISISSGYRCKRLNSAVGGASTSQHIRGQAADIRLHGDIDYGKRLFEWIKANVEFDQLIMEHDRNGTHWVHVSYNSQRNRRQVIRNLVK